MKLEITVIGLAKSVVHVLTTAVSCLTYNRLSKKQVLIYTTYLFILAYYRSQNILLSGRWPDGIYARSVQK